jgi:NO-binding membrane sensor protein with MHYT domain
MKWGRILVAGIGTCVAVLLVITLVATGYAFKLAFEVRGAPDQARIGQFAAHLGRSYWWVLQILLTAPAAVCAVRKVQRSPQLHGVLVGLVAAATGFAIAFTVSVRTLAAFALTVGAGWLGGAVAARHRRKQDRGTPTTRRT